MLISLPNLLTKIKLEERAQVKETSESAKCHEVTHSTLCTFIILFFKLSTLCLDVKWF